MIHLLSSRGPQAVGSALLLTADVTNTRDARAGHIVASGHSAAMESRVTVRQASPRL